MNENKKQMWKNFTALVIIFSILFVVFIYNIRIGFSVFDWTDATISSMFILNAIIVLLSVPLVVFALLYRKKKKGKNRE